MRVAMVQLSAGPDPAVNRDVARDGIAEAARRRPDLVVLPEATMRDLGPAGTDIAGDAEPLDGPFVAMLAQAARTHGCTVVAGMFETDPAHPRPFNTVVAVGPDGAVVETYRKVHLYDAFGYRESDRLSAGDLRPVTFPVTDAVVGLMTCYDLRFPEQSRVLADAGATVLVLPAAWVRGPYKEDHWETLVRARAIENTAYVVAVGQCGPAYCGRSLAVDPLGVVLAGMGEASGVAAAELRPERVEHVRQSNPSLALRRWAVTPR